MCRKSAGIKEDLQVLLKICIKSASIPENLRKICRALPKICGYYRISAENLQVLQKMCRRSASITENVHKICRYYRKSAGRCRKSESVTQHWKNYHAKNKVQINQRLRNQRQREIGVWDQESEKLETSQVPSDTLCETPTVKT